MAGGGAPVPSGGGGKKSVDFQLNLVPMIDLLSVLISFLLMSAVWTQIARIEVKQSPNLPSDEPPPEEEEEKLSLRILIKADAYVVTSKKGHNETIERTSDDEANRTKLSELLEKIKTEHPDNKEVTVASEDDVPYQELVTVMDVCVTAELRGISVAGAGT